MTANCQVRVIPIKAANFYVEYFIFTYLSKYLAYAERKIVQNAFNVFKYTAKHVHVLDSFNLVFFVFIAQKIMLLIVRSLDYIYQFILRFSFVGFSVIVAIVYVYSKKIIKYIICKINF